MIRALLIALLAIGSLTLTAQTDPTTQPLLQPGSIKYVGQFKVPDTDGTGFQTNNQFTWSWIGVAGVAGPGRLYFACHGQVNAILGIVEVPAIGGVAKVIEPCRQMPNYTAIGNDPSTKHVGGAWLFGTRHVVDAYPYYDGGMSQVTTHWHGTALNAMAGPSLVQAQNVTLGADKHFPRAGMMPGWMGPIPAEWQPLLGGPAYTGQGAIAITARTSFGPSFSVFDPAKLGTVATVPATLLMGYPDEHQTLGPWGPTGGAWRVKLSPYYSGADMVAGVIWPVGTRSIISIGRHGTGLPEMQGDVAYGVGTSNVALIDQPDGLGNRYVYDPSDSNKGPHAYPYQAQAMAYDALDLAAVKAGTKQPWDVKPYAVWNFAAAGTPLDNKGIKINGATYDPSSRRLYVTAGWTDVYVFEVGSAPPPPTDNCVYTWGPKPPLGWDRVPGSESACADNSRTYQERRDLVYESGDKATCPSTPQFQTNTEACTVDPPVDQCAANPVVVTQVAWPGSTEGRRSGSLVWSVANTVTTLKSIQWNYGPQSVTVTDSRGCAATVKR
jgi:hypothetical protein